jgi:hypothetical protein
MAQEKYDFYNNHPNTKHDIKQYIVTWLEPVLNDSNKYQNWTQVFGFRRGFVIHGVYVNDKTKEYAFHVIDPDSYNTYNNFPNLGSYDSYETMLEGVVDKYAKLWGING